MAKKQFLNFFVKCYWDTNLVFLQYIKTLNMPQVQQNPENLLNETCGFFKGDSGTKLKV